MYKPSYLLYGPKTATSWGTPVNLKGAQGAPGGAANVKVDTFTVAGNDWIWNSQYIYETSASSYTEYFTRYYVRLNSSITQAVLDGGAVIAYFQPSPVNNPGQWAPLPYQFDSSFGYTFNYVYVTSPGQIVLHYFFIQTDSTATVPTLSTYNDETRMFKVVAISGNIIAAARQKHINLNNYDEMARFTGIK